MIAVSIDTIEQHQFTSLLSVKHLGGQAEVNDQVVPPTSETSHAGR